MKILLLSVVLVLLTLPLSPPANAKGDPAAGKKLFAAKCQACHGPEGEGKESIGKLYKTTMRALAGKEVQAKSDDDLKKAMTVGSDKVKKTVKLKDPEAVDVIAFVRSLKK